MPEEKIFALKLTADGLAVSASRSLNPKCAQNPTSMCHDGIIGLHASWLVSACMTYAEQPRDC